MCRAYYRCEVGNCGKPALEVHHLTYERIYREELMDLLAVCQRCHDVLTDDNCQMVLECLDGGGLDCACPVCEYRRVSHWLNRQRRDRLAKAVNRHLHTMNLRLYGAGQQWSIRAAGLWSKNLPPSLVCPRTGVPANTPAACGRCDTCNWVAALETAFAEEESEPDE